MASVKRKVLDDGMTMDNKKAKLDFTSSAEEDLLSALPVTNKAQPTLLGLPREIRDMIWAFAIAGHEITPRATSRTKVRVKASPYNHRGETVAQWKYLHSLALVNRQLRKETELLPYSLSVVNSVCNPELEQWLAALREEQRDAIRTVSFGYKIVWAIHDHKSIYGGSVGAGGLQYLSGLKNLEKVIIRDTLSLRQERKVKDAVRDLGVDIVCLKTPRV
ncbi:hypothetical protein NX059_003820 [Plenodomus lindquistii]|nr:hypothetical protein NX059_003820 [Plenodomus lindquistii]